MLQLTIYYGKAGSGKSFNAFRAKTTLKHTAAPIVVDGVYSAHAFALLADLMKGVYAAAGEALPAENLHLIITTRMPLHFFEPYFKGIPQVHFIECNYQPLDLLQ